MSDGEVLKVIVYSSDRLVREQIRLALGRSVAADLPDLEITEFATQPAAMKAMDSQHFDVGIFDGEALPGGMGLAHQVKDEVPDAPLILVLIPRLADAWLATWSNADAVSAYPVDPVRLPEDVANLVRTHREGKTTPLTSEYVAPGISSRHSHDDGHDIPTR